MGRSAGLTALILLVATASAAASPCGGPARAIRELPSVDLTLPLGVAVAADGGVWIASTMADRLVRVDPEGGGTATSFPLPLRSHPVGIAVDSAGAVWFAGSTVGLVGRLAPGAKKPVEFPPAALLRASDSGMPVVWGLGVGGPGPRVWFTMPSHGRVGHLDARAQPTRRGSVVTEVAPGVVRPEGIAVDAAGAAWVADLTGETVTRVAPDGTSRVARLPGGSRPRGIAVDASGAAWVALFGVHRLARVDAATLAVQTWPLGGGDTAPWAVAVDGDGGVWVSMTARNAIACFDPGRARLAEWPVPTPRASVRSLAVDRRGRVWFVGAYSGRLGVVAEDAR